jgi:hypothetical protein
MNNEPVVWTACLDCGKRVTGDSIHTCSPQIKDLTDEEVKEIATKHIHMTLSGERFGYLEFARAILKKAQEK